MLKRLLGVALFAAPLFLAACTESQTVAVAIAGCNGWNEAEIALAPSIKNMSDGEHRAFLRGFATLSGGTPLQPTKRGLCRQPVPPSQAAVVGALVDAAMAEITPLLTKYAKK